MNTDPAFAFREHENIFRTLVEESPAPMGLYTGREMTIMLANSAILQVWGKDASIIGKTFRQALPELDGQLFFQLLDDVFTSGIAYEAVNDRVDLLVDGQMQTFYFNFTYKPLKNANGQVWAVLNTATDVTELVLARQKLTEADERTRLVLESTGLGTWDMNPITEEGVWDDRCQELFGFSPGARVAYRDVLKYIHPEDADYVNSEVMQAIDPAVNKPYDIKYRTAAEDVEIKWIRAKGKAYFNKKGICNRFAGTVQDITEEVINKQALIESERLLQNITNASPTALWMSDHNGKIIYANKTWADWTGQTNEEALGNGWINAIIPDDRERAGTQFLSDLGTRRIYTADFRIKRRDGEIRWCIANGNPKYRHDGSFAGYIGSFADITEKIWSERQLNEKNAELNDQIKRFEFVTSFMPVQLWTAKTDGELDYVNQRTIEFFGVPAKDIIGPAWQSFVHPDDFAACINVWVHSLTTGDPYQFEFRLKDKQGSYKWHLARALPFISDGKIVKWFGTNTDIDEQKQLQRQKDDFLGIASHELKTPVTSIKAYAQVLGAMLKKEGEDKKAEMVLRMDAQVNRLTNLIGDLLDVTKINSGRLQFNKTWFNFNQVIKETVEDLQHTTQKHTLIEDFSFTGEIYSDKDRISQVITNLITNAIKYSPYSEKIIVSTKLEGNEAVVCVKDFGIGIPDDKTDKVFEQFYRVSGNKQHTFPGLGLGLYISFEIIKREGGRMWVNSIEGKGSTFCFALPANVSPEKKS